MTREEKLEKCLIDFIKATEKAQSEQGDWYYKPYKQAKELLKQGHTTPIDDDTSSVCKDYTEGVNMDCRVCGCAKYLH